MRVWAFLGYALLALAQVGCVAPSDGGEHALETIHAFTARIERRDASHAALTLDGPVVALDRDLVARKAYRLTVVEEPPDGPPFPPQIYYLDAGLRVVAVQDACVGPHADCVNASTTRWSAQGALPPYGVALPAILSAEGALVSLANRTLVTIPHVLHREADRVVLDVEPRPGVGLEGIEAGPFSYAAGQWVPSSEGQTVAAYVQGPPLGRADAWPIALPSLRPAAWEGRMFPGEAADDFGIGFTHAAFLDALEDATGAPVAAGRACVLSYQLSIPPAPRENATRLAAEIFLLGDDGLVARYDVRAARGPNGTAEFETSPPASFPTDVTCAQARRSPWPTMDSASFLKLADALPVWGIEPVRFSFQVGLPRFLAPRAPEDGWHTFGLFWTPSHVSAQDGSAVDYVDYQVTVDAHTGWLESMTANPSASLPAR